MMLTTPKEFMTPEQISNAYPHFPYTFSQIISDNHRNQWVHGDWTDDTDQSILLLRCALRNRDKTPYEISLLFAQDLLSWAQYGLDPKITGDTCGTGIGRPVAWVIRESLFVSNPHQAARDIWELSEKSLAEDGALMRTSFLACLPESWDRIRQIAIECCKITHADDRCIGTVVFTTFWLFCVLRNIPVTIDEVCKMALLEMSRKKKTFRGYLLPRTLSECNLSEPVYRCHTRSPFKALIWTIRNKPSYEEGIWSIIAQGGDADTNAAVSGALLGAQFPNQVISEGLKYPSILENLIQEILQYEKG